jgi:hypothetical protein
MTYYSEQVFEQNERVNIVVDFEFNCLPRWNQQAEICKILLLNTNNNKTYTKVFKTEKPISVGSNICMNWSLDNTNATDLFSESEWYKALSVVLDKEVDENIHDEINLFGFGIKTDKEVLSTYVRKISYRYYYYDLADFFRLTSKENELLMCNEGSSLECCYYYINQKPLNVNHGDDSELEAIYNIYQYVENCFINENENWRLHLTIFPFGNFAGMDLIDYCEDYRRQADGYRYNNDDLLSVSITASIWEIEKDYNDWDDDDDDDF